MKNPCIPGINPTWSWCMILLMYCWIWFASILLSIFASMFIGDIVIFFFYVPSLSGFGIRVMVASKNEFGSSLSMALFWNSFRKTVLLTLLQLFDTTHLWSHLVLDLSLLEVLKSVSIQYLWSVCSYFLFPDLVFRDCTFLRMCPFLLSCPFYCHIVACSSLLWSSVFLWCPL